jgi:hypothetical protein
MRLRLNSACDVNDPSANLGGYHKPDNFLNWRGLKPPWRAPNGRPYELSSMTHQQEREHVSGGEM